MKKGKNIIQKHRSLQSFLGFLCTCFLFTHTGFSQEKPHVSSKIDTTFIKIGEQIQYTITVETDTTDFVHFPEGQTFSPLETVEGFITDTTRKKNRYTLQKIYALTQFDSGTYVIPQQLISINEKPFFTDSVRVNVATVTVDTLKQKMFDIKSLIAVENNYNTLWTTLFWVFLVLLLIGGLIYWFVLRKKPLTEEEKEALLPPFDRAILELKRLENSKYIIQDEYKKYYSELTDIVRSYLEEEVHVSAMESTTDQLIEKLEMLRDAGNLDLERSTIDQFKQVLRTSDLVKFAKSKPASSVAEQDRKSIEEIVIKTKDALPEPTEEELMEQEEYQEELAHKKVRKKWILAGSLGIATILIAMISVTLYYGPTYTWDTISGNPTKKLLEGEWVESSYGFPPIIINAPEVLVRKEVEIPQDTVLKIKDLQIFGYRNTDTFFDISAIATTHTEPIEPDFQKAIEDILRSFEDRGAKNIITKQEEFTTISGVKGVKTYGSGKFNSPDSKALEKGKYVILSFGGKGFKQQVILTWLEEDSYAQEIIDRIIQTIEVKLEV